LGGKAVFISQQFACYLARTSAKAFLSYDYALHTLTMKIRKQKAEAFHVVKEKLRMTTSIAVHPYLNSINE
jgi:hypothetical protein